MSAGLYRELLPARHQRVRLQTLSKWRHLSWQLRHIQVHLPAWLHRSHMSGGLREKYPEFIFRTPCLICKNELKLLLVVKSEMWSCVFKTICGETLCFSFVLWFRTWFTGVTRLPVKMEGLAGRQVPPTAASVRPVGRAFTAMSQVFPVRSQPNKEVRKRQNLSWFL